MPIRVCMALHPCTEMHSALVTLWQFILTPLLSYTYQRKYKPFEGSVFGRRPAIATKSTAPLCVKPKASPIIIYHRLSYRSSFLFMQTHTREKCTHFVYIYINICNWLLLLLPLWGSTHIHYHSAWTSNPCFTTTKSSLCNVLVVGLLVLVNICICIWSSSSAMLNVRTDGRRTADHIGRLGFFFYIFKKLRVAIKCIRWAKFINSKRHGIDMFIKRFGLIIWDWTYFSFDVWTFVK